MLYSKALVLGLANMIRSIILILLDPDSHLKFYALKLNRKITSVMILFLCFYFRLSPSNMFYNQLNVSRDFPSKVFLGQSDSNVGAGCKSTNEVTYWLKENESVSLEFGVITHQVSEGKYVWLSSVS